nr:retrovirus-related Pol polyprotein from transposon TNT 1-94 [Tanacetum cinerariifolium]
MLLRVFWETGYGSLNAQSLTMFLTFKCINDPQKGNPQHALKDKRVINSGCSRHMTGTMSYLTDFEEINSGYVAFGGNPKGGKISGKGKIRTGKLDFDDVYFVKELKFNLFSISQMCDKKNSVLFTDTECIVLSHEFQLPDENYVLLRVPRENNMYNVDLKNIVPSRDLTCLFAKATLDETLIEAARTMLVDSLLPIPFWVEAVNTACYVQNRVLVTKPHNKTPYKLLLGRTPSISFMRPFGCLVTIFNTLDRLGKFDGKADEGFLVGYSVSSKAFRVFNSRTRIVQETLHINFLKNKPNVAGVQEQFDAEKTGEEHVQQYVLFPLWSSGSKDPQNTDGDATFKVKEPEFEGRKPENLSEEFEDFSDNSINEVNAAITPVPTVGQITTNSTNTFSAAGPSNTAVSPTLRESSYVNPSQYPDDPNMPALEDITYSDDEEDVGAEADFSNLKTTITVSPTSTTRVHKDHHTVVATSSTKAEYVATASCCTQVKKVNDVMRLQALIDRKKVIITEATVREALQLDDAESIDCLPNEEIFTELARMGEQVGDLSSHTTKYSSPALTQKVFANMRRIGKRFSGVETPLFKGMSVPQQAATDVDDVFNDDVTADDVPAADKKEKLRVSGLKRLRKVGATQRIESSTDIVMDDQEDASKHREIIANIDANKDVTLKDVVDVTIAGQRKEKKDNDVLRYQALKRKPQTEAQARKNMIVYLKNMARFKMEYFKGMSYDDIRLIFEKYFNSNVAFLEKSKEQLEEEESRALKRQRESLEEKAAKKQKLDEEVEELKKYLYIVPNDDGDVYAEATPLALKVPVIDYEIYSKNNKPFYKIIRADGSHQLFLSFLSLLRNFDREHLEMLWQIVQERFTSSKPKNFSDDFLLTTLTYMFEKPDVEAQVWKNQRNDLASREKISIDKVQFRSDDEQYDAADIKLRLLEQSAAVDRR